MVVHVKEYKKIIYLKETTFAEVYDNSGTYQEILAAELTQDRSGEQLSTLYMQKNRKLNETRASGRNTGSFTFSKNLDASLIEKHTDILEKAIGDYTAPTIANETITAFSSETVLVGTGGSTNITAGMFVKVEITVDSRVVTTSANLVASIATADVTFAHPFSDQEFLDMQAGDSAVMVQCGTVSPSAPIQDTSFTFVIEYDDDSCEVYRGCGISGAFEITTEGQALINFEVQAAVADNQDTLGNLYVDVTGTGTINPETQRNPIIFDFEIGRLWDASNGTPANLTLFPQALTLALSHELIPNKLIGGVNNINGWYTKPSLQGEADFDRDYIDLFSKKYEGDSNQFMFYSQPHFTFYAPLARFSTVNAGASLNDFDALHMAVDVNHDSNNIPLFVFPEL